MITSESSRYTGPDMAALFAPKARVSIARAIWIGVLVAQARCGVDIPEAAIAAYSKVMNSVDMEAHWAAEAVTGHETKAWIEVFNQQAGYQLIHQGMTSCDITENIITYQVHEATSLICGRMIGVLRRLDGLIRAYRDIPMVGRTHNVPAQAVTLGRRFAVCAQELLAAWTGVGSALREYPSRGVAGAVGTSADLLRLFGGDYQKVVGVNSTVASLINADSIWTLTGQTAPRIKEGQIAAALLGVCSGPASMSLTLRLMAGQGLSSERRTAEQTGSTAMPHKSNPRFAERVEGLQIVARGYAQMITDTMGKTWNEGDVSDSAVRRVAIPGLFATVDGLLRTFMVALDRFDPDLDEISREVRRHRWSLDSGRLLAIATRNGVPREEAHRKLRVWFDANDRLPISHLIQALGCSMAEFDKYLDQRDEEGVDAGASREQIDSILQATALRVESFPAEAGYEPQDML